MLCKAKLLRVGVDSSRWILSLLGIWTQHSIDRPQPTKTRQNHDHRNWSFHFCNLCSVISILLLDPASHGRKVRPGSPNAKKLQLFHVPDSCWASQSHPSYVNQHDTSRGEDRNQWLGFNLGTLVHRRLRSLTCYYVDCLRNVSRGYCS